MPAATKRPTALGPTPTVTIVFLVYNRREELRTSLRMMLEESEYDPALVDVIVVDNASTDGSGEMVKRDFPQVKLIRREVNSGVSGWNDGFAAATGDVVLVLDDDCYLPPDGLTRAIEAMREYAADLVSFNVVAADAPDYFFTEIYRTGLLAFWGCAAVVRREVFERIGGFDPEIFVWAHEVEFMFRFYDRGFRHLHLPDVVALHMKDTGGHAHWSRYFGTKAYRINATHYAYVAAKHLRARHAASTLMALLALNVRDGFRAHWAAFTVMIDTIKGFVRGLRNRQPVRNREISKTYRHNFYSFASPWWVSRTPRELIGLDTADAPPVEERVEQYFSDRRRYYPTSTAALDF